MRERRNSLLAGIGAALFGCAAAPVIADLPVAGRAEPAPAPAVKAELDARVAAFGAGKFDVTGARYAVPDAGLGWQPILSRVATDPAVQRGATRLTLASDSPETWLIEVWRTRGRAGLAVAMLGTASDGERLLGYYALRFAPGYTPVDRAPGKG